MQTLRARLFGTRAEAATPEDLSIVDHAQRWLRATGTRCYQWIGAQSPWAQQRLDDIVAHLAELERAGFLNHFHEFNTSLLSPLQSGMHELAASVEATARCVPGQNVMLAFSLWNVLCFWLSVVLLVISLLLPGGSAVADVINVFCAYVAAYSYAFVFVRAPRTQWMLGGCIIIGLWVTWQVLSGLGGLVFVVPAAMAFARAAAAAMLLVYAVQLYRASAQAAEDGARPEGWVSSRLFGGPTRRVVVVEML